MDSGKVGLVSRSIQRNSDPRPRALCPPVRSLVAPGGAENKAAHQARYAHSKLLLTHSGNKTSWVALRTAKRVSHEIQVFL